MRYIGLVLLFVFLEGCAPKEPLISDKKVDRLSMSLIAMDSSVDKNEARQIAREAIVYSHDLAYKYKVQTSPWVHNFLVNVGLKKRGLCYQWADDLLTHLSLLHPQSLKFLPIGANIGDYWKEHNAVVVLPSRKHISLSDGIILDAWRHSGDLYFTSVDKDTKYKWGVRTERLYVVEQ